jgi:hypothetical protein
MTANELRLENIVEDIFDLRNPKIRRIDIEDFVMIRNYGFHPIPFKPIPITEEWLLKAGFRDNYGYTSEWLDLNRGLEPICYETYEDYAHVLGKKIEYVHQLQNLYFALSGEELKINI